MFKNIWDNFFPKTSKYEVESRLVDVFDTDFQMVVTGYFKFDTKNLEESSDEEKINSSIQQALYSIREYGYLVSWTRDPRLKIISRSEPDLEGNSEVHFELTTSFYASYMARDEYEAIEKAKVYFKNETRIPGYLRDVKALAIETVGDVKITGRKQVRVFKGEIGFDASA